MTKNELLTALEPISGDTIVCTYGENGSLTEVDHAWLTQVAGNQIGRKTGLMDAVVLY